MGTITVSVFIALGVVSFSYLDVTKLHQNSWFLNFSIFNFSI